ncbi:8-oxoguanine DNA glycosylase [Halorientalis sp. IM1011]|uniref:DNA-3-methyladenine glycosylase family protein n=1 Tax=Halorientalis sp. IM1011 TaxID=1932360 RepID=UPI00097CC4ED|nr:DNA glycosylase [Halorientalis sp. IM1011]AQL44188.1 8-oxoguanine DNA glycosylase [Halorientalis sp. IM1011]
MRRGRIDARTLAGGVDLQSTVESGQSYLWAREDGATYEDDRAHGGDAWYWTTTRPADRDEPAVVRVRQVDGALEWESHVDAEPHLRRLLRLDDDLDAIRHATPDDRLLREAFETYRGMRVVRDPPFGALISFICSAQMRVGRIHDMQISLRREFGEPVTFDGETYYAYPTPEALADATEAQLREVGLGYRAPYVQRSAEMVADGTADPAEARTLSYEDAREFLTRFVGVGEKVADCVLLFSLDFLEAVPLDTWIQTTIEEYYPDCDRDSYAETSRAIRAAFGDEYAGYVQTYVFHYLRNGGE